MVTRRFRGTALALCLGALLVFITACGSSSEGGGTSAGATNAATASSTTGGEDAASGVGAARAQVDKLRAEITEFTPPGPEIDASSLKGKSVWYITLSASIPALNGNAEGVKEAAQALGLEYNTCDGKFTPAQMSACIRQAVNARPAGIITNGIDPANVAPAMKAAADAEIPIMALSTDGEESDVLRFIGNGDAESQAAAMDWIIADSDGEANILAITLKGSVQTEQSAAAGVAELEKNCPACKYEGIELTDGQIGSVASATSSALLKNPQADYGFPQFDFFAPDFQRGMRQAGRARTMKMLSTNATASQLREIASGGQAADAGVNSNYVGWATMDGLLRLILGEPPADNVTAPIRIFDETNVDSIQLTDEAQATGEWWGPTTYKEEFPALWGVGQPDA